ncbi:uncharacterized protein TEOVI_000879100 [Trypanosoma equiperdum]|uniref:T. brucei spp.-specific protein n=3 Tax=Trypanozoon TaxID=39700 RepID=Q38AX9_TRYB2|nr:hypothetical protein Tb10.70.0560 [Trypanosoma brucei brucei TREU927]EAN78041.1 hypothetical protein Tb10.70.0560 [Trypanosoma brucei brucei TREU927]RHW69713.1 hypothetical protein DPX39_100068500 [Trypanosoma brucei equiperdum]SCU73189.1 hypothetical protein, conserved [Trypanosoma equiperdum]
MARYIYYIMLYYLRFLHQQLSPLLCTRGGGALLPGIGWSNELGSAIPLGYLEVPRHYVIEGVLWCCGPLPLLVERMNPSSGALRSLLSLPSGVISSDIYHTVIMVSACVKKAYRFYCYVCLRFCFTALRAV